MPREVKLGLIIAGAFLSLIGGVVATRLLQTGGFEEVEPAVARGPVTVRAQQPEPEPKPEAKPVKSEPADDPTEEAPPGTPGISLPEFPPLGTPGPSPSTEKELTGIVTPSDIVVPPLENSETPKAAPPPTPGPLQPVGAVESPKVQPKPEPKPKPTPTQEEPAPVPEISTLPEISATTKEPGESPTSEMGPDPGGQPLPKETEPGGMAPLIPVAPGLPSVEVPGVPGTIEPPAPPVAEPGSVPFVPAPPPGLGNPSKIEPEPVPNASMPAGLRSADST